jgi:hypothetical protein
MTKLMSLTVAALIGVSAAGAGPAFAHKRHGHGHFHGFGHKVKFCYFDRHYDEFVCKWRWRRSW